MTGHALTAKAETILLNRSEPRQRSSEQRVARLENDGVGTQQTVAPGISLIAEPKLALPTPFPLLAPVPLH